MDAAQNQQLNKIEELIRGGQKQRAFAQLAQHLAHDQSQARAWRLLSQCVDDNHKKEYSLRRAIRLDPTDAEARKLLWALTQEVQAQQKLRDPPVAESAMVEQERLPYATLTERFKNSAPYRMGKFLLKRAAIIFLTITLGVFVAVLIANKGGQIDESVQSEIETAVRNRVGMINTPDQQVRLERALCSARSQAGLLLPTVPRNLLWAFRALTLEWGEVNYTTVTGMYASRGNIKSVKAIILDRLPNSLMLVGIADLIIFLVGIPLALTLSRQRSSWQDKLFSFLAPISSIPSWILGLLLILIFSVQLQVLPPSGMFDIVPPTTSWGYITVVGKHMIMPVLAIILSMIFQLIYTWRTFFLIYSSEDYVELAKAKGLDDKTLEKRYILRPSAPFILTTFSLTLVGFWQMTTALEVVFEWPGIGKLYVDSLPHYWGESFFPGEMLIAIGLVVLFAYLLGFIVFMLDLLYALLDPRVKFSEPAISSRAVRRKSAIQSPIDRLAELAQSALKMFTTPARRGLPKTRKRSTARRVAGLKRQVEGMLGFMREIRRYPSALFGFLIIVGLICGSVYAVLALPYAEIGTRWYTEGVSGEITVPKLAQPAWFNLFRRNKLLTSFDIGDGSPGFTKVSESFGNGSGSVTITYTFDYNYGAMPEELFINFTPKYVEKRPFIVLKWMRPDGEEIELKGFSVEASGRVQLADHMPRELRIDERTAMAWGTENYGSLFLKPLFYASDAPDVELLKGQYILRVEGFIFEENSDLDAELVALGQVHGPAGTDYLRRDLLVPLLWGMPFALLFGLFGATATTILSMILAATGVWFGGWVDGLVRSLNEATMILPILAFAVLFYAMFDIDLWLILTILVLLNVFGSPTKAFRAAFLQVKESPFIEAAQAYGASNWRVILVYMVPRIIPVLIPQLVALIPSFVFLEATLGMFNITTIYPTWGKVIYDALRYGFSWGSRYWVLEPISLLLLTGFAFAMVGFALDQILNPRLKSV